jgi:hypothetical protein
MSSLESLYNIVHARFRDAFGQPHNVQGGGEQWTLEPSPKYRSAIHVLLNGTPAKPGVWVFDPHDPKTGVENTPIVEPRQIGDIISLIQQRLNFASGKRDKASAPGEVTALRAASSGGPAAPTGPPTTPPAAAAPRGVEPRDSLPRRRRLHHGDAAR